MFCGAQKQKSLRATRSQIHSERSHEKGSSHAKDGLQENHNFPYIKDWLTALDLHREERSSKQSRNNHTGSRRFARDDEFIKNDVANSPFHLFVLIDLGRARVILIFMLIFVFPYRLRLRLKVSTHQTLCINQVMGYLMLANPKLASRLWRITPYPMLYVLLILPLRLK